MMHRNQTFCLTATLAVVTLLHWQGCTSIACAQGSQQIFFEREPDRQLIRGSRCFSSPYLTYWSDVVPWLAECEQRIRHAGFDQQVFKDKHITIRMDVRNYVGSLTLIQGSGCVITDKAALKLITCAAPFSIPEFALPPSDPLILELHYPRLELKSQAWRPGDTHILRQVSTARDWQAGDIELRIRNVVQPQPIPNVLGFDYGQLSKRFENKSVSYRLTVKPDGSIAELKVRRTSGSDDIDRKGLDLIRAAAPFHPAWGGISTEQTYIVGLPRVTVTSIN